MVAHPTLLLGWREWVALPGLGIDRIKAKLDTGARTSALHALDIEPVVVEGVDRVRFSVHPAQRSPRSEVRCEADVLDQRRIRSSNGVETIRWTILTPLRVAGWAWDIELTLVGRDEMGFRMLLGRTALRGHAFVDPGRSFAAGRKPKRG